MDTQPRDRGFDRREFLRKGAIASGIAAGALFIGGTASKVFADDPDPKLPVCDPNEGCPPRLHILDANRTYPTNHKSTMGALWNSARSGTANYTQSDATKSWADLHHGDMFNVGACDEGDEWIAGHAFQYLPQTSIDSMYNDLLASGWSITHADVQSALTASDLPTQAYQTIRSQGGVYAAFSMISTELARTSAALRRGQINNAWNQIDTCGMLHRAYWNAMGIATIFGLISLVGGGPVSGLVAATAAGIGLFAEGVMWYNAC